MLIVNEVRLEVALETV